MRRLTLVIPNLGGGGAERVLLNLAHGWLSQGHQVSIVTQGPQSEDAYEVDPRLNRTCLRTQPPNYRFDRYWFRYYPKHLIELRKAIAESKPDVIVSFLSQMNASTIFASRGLGIPVIACEHNNPYQENLGPTRTFLKEWSYRFPESVTMLTTDLIEPYGAKVGRKLDLMPNPIDPALYELQTDSEACREARTTLGLPKDRKILGSLGRLDAQKGYDVLIPQFAKLASAHPDWDLWIWGEGAQRAELEALIATHGLEGRVVLPGRTSKPWQAMLACDLVVISSRFEGFCLVLAEAMALGRPCISFDCPSGPADITQNGEFAQLVPAWDWEQMQSQLHTLMGDDHAREVLGQKGTAIRPNYHLQTILNEWEKLFCQLGLPQ